ncbi:MAG: Sulfonate transport system permease protein [Hyphomicrobiales bacterium]|nr:Sulfonate transport system permease protein [Hyphomicrobiales bacterium]
MSEAGTLDPARDTASDTRTTSARRRFAVSGSTFLLGLILPVSTALAYEAAFRLGLVQARLLPPPSKILVTLWDLARSGELATHVGATTLRVLLGFGLGSLAGMLLGALTGSSPTARRLLDPTLQALRAIPSLAWVPLFILWLGIFENSKIALIATGVFFPVYLGVMAAIANVDRKIVEVGRAFRLSRSAMARRVLLPAILPDFVVALRSGLGLGFMFVVAAEIMGASEGLGYLLVDGQQLGKPDQILAAIIAFAILGKFGDWLLVAGSKPFLSWQDSHSRIS